MVQRKRIGTATGHAAGRISVELIRTHLPAGNAEFYYCGPIGFMAATERVLDELGVPVQRRHSEAFAPDASFGVSLETTR